MSPHFTYGRHVSKICSLATLHAHHNHAAVLDPRISYSALKDEFDDDLDLSSHLEVAKDDLHMYFKENYITTTTPSLSTTPQSQHSQASTSVAQGSPQKNFMARFQRKPRTMPMDELLEFWKLPQEDVENCVYLYFWCILLVLLAKPSRQ